MRQVSFTGNTYTDHVQTYGSWVFREDFRGVKRRSSAIPRAPGITYLVSSARNEKTPKWASISFFDGRITNEPAAGEESWRPILPIDKRSAGRGMEGPMRGTPVKQSRRRMLNGCGLPPCPPPKNEARSEKAASPLIATISVYKR